MLNRTNLLILAVAIAGAVGGFLAGGWLKPQPSSVAGERPLRVGEAHEPFALPDVDGRQHDIAEWNGKLVLVNFWATWCAPCREEMPLLERAQQALAARGLQVVGVAIDSPAAVRHYLADAGVSYPILVDDPASAPDLSTRYGNTRSVLPFSVLIGRDGRIVDQRMGSFREADLQAWIERRL